MGKLDCRSTGIGSEIGASDRRRHHSRKATAAINEKFGKLRQAARILQLMGMLAAAFLLTIGTRGGLANPSAEDIARSWSTNSCLWQDKFAIVSSYFNEKTGYKKKALREVVWVDSTQKWGEGVRAWAACM